MTIVIMGRNISSWGRKSDLKICLEAETIRPKMTIRPLDEQALSLERTDIISSLYFLLFHFQDNKFHAPSCR